MLVVGHIQGVTIETIAPGDGKNFPSKGGEWHPQAHDCVVVYAPILIAYV